MAPNLFLCLRTFCCPTYWFQHGNRIDGAVNREQHWDSPVPGTYKFFPGRGWYLIQRDEGDHDEKLPAPVVYCRVLHRNMFESELEDRCRWFSASLHKGGSPEPLQFFLLDDGVTWVAAWDVNGHFIQGPYPKWWLDEDGVTMHRGATPPTSACVSRCNSFVAGKFD